MAAKREEIFLGRRTFLIGSVNAGLLMGLGSLLPGCSKEQALEQINAGDMSRTFSPVVWFEIDASGDVLINIAKAEMGQHVGTALARIVADELGADWDAVHIKHVDSDPRWGYMVTGGSWSVFTSYKVLSQAGAAGRSAMIEAGAALLGVAPDECSAESSRVSSGDKQITYAEIVQRGDISKSFSAEELEAMPIKAPQQRNYIGKATRARDVPAKSRGEAIYGLDVELPGIVYAHPLIPPTRYGSSISAINDEKARSIPGYIKTIKIDDPSETIQGWALVIAETFPAAMLAAKAVSVDWKAGPTANVGEADLISHGQTLAADKSSGVLVVDDGDVAQARASATKKHRGRYTTSTALHFTLEPQNALVEFKKGICHVHAGNQWQSLILPVLAKALQIPETDIVLHQYYLGGGFGRRLFGDQMIPAALAARQLQRPVKLVFERDADSRFDCVRSPSVQQFDASFDASGKLTGIEHAAAAGWPTLTMAPGFLADGVDGNGKFDAFSISGGDHWYSLPNHRVRAINNDLAQRTFLPGWLRAVGPGWVGWGVESFMDELAIIAGMDPIAFRLAMLDGSGKNSGTPGVSTGGARRLAAVLDDVRQRSDWGEALPEGEGMGVAVSHGQERTMPTWTACVAHVAVDKNQRTIKLKKLWQSIDCGTVVHPDGALAQAEGASLWGVSLALHEGASFENGHVAQRNLDSYTPLRMADVPDLAIHFMPSTEHPTGLGEPPLIAVPPAIGNAVYAASGIRARDLPIRL